MRSSDGDVAQLKRLIEIQGQIVKQARQNERAEKNRGGILRKLAVRSSVVRRLIGFVSQL